MSDYNTDRRGVFEPAYTAKSAEINDNRPLSDYSVTHTINVQ